MASLASSMAMVPAQASSIQLASPFESEQVQIETIKTFAEVLPENTGVSQEFRFGHPGIDITTPLGSKIYSLKAGKVIRLENLKWNYGRAAYIDNGNGVVTLYAHMGKVYVEEGDEVKADQPIGEVGLTGKTTGPHLHLEIRKNGIGINPRPFLALSKRVIAIK